MSFSLLQLVIVLSGISERDFWSNRRIQANQGSALSTSTDFTWTSGKDYFCYLCFVIIIIYHLLFSPASVRKKDESFYLAPLSCSPGSTLWYSPQKLPREMLARMLHRVLLVQEVLRGFV